MGRFVFRPSYLVKREAQTRMPEEKSETGGLSGVVWGRSCEEAETGKPKPAVLLSHGHAEPLSVGL
jgi:hypothetical protein